MKKLLILGGTGDGVKLALGLNQFPEIEITTSLAGRTSQPKLLPGKVRIGGFGGVNGLVEYLKENRIDCVIDVTHPCAGQISQNAFLAAKNLAIPHLIIVRPQWEKSPTDRWIEVNSIESAARSIPADAKHIFITTGRQNLAPFVDIPGVWLLIRSIEPPDQIITNSALILDRGPFSLEAELHLLIKHQIDLIITKNSGGAATFAKILAARELNIPVVMVQRPPLPPAQQVSSIEAAIGWLQQLKILT